MGWGSDNQMSRFYAVDPRSDATETIEFAELAEIAKGTSVIGVNNADGILEFKLSEDLIVRFQPRDRLHVTVQSTTDPRGAAPVRFQLLAQGEEPSAAVVEERLRRLRQAYAISFLVTVRREADIANKLTDDPHADLEDLLAPEDRLYVQSASSGTFWVTVLAKTRAAQKALRDIASLAFPEGREHLLRRVRADTELKELDVTAKKISLAKSYVELLAQVEKIKDPKRRDAARNSIDSTLSVISTKLPSSSDQ
jgi:hypothetical protein